MSRDEFESIKSVKRRRVSDLFKIPGVHGVGVGYVLRDGEVTGQIGRPTAGRRASD